MKKVIQVLSVLALANLGLIRATSPRQIVVLVEGPRLFALGFDDLLVQAFQSVSGEDAQLKFEIIDFGDMDSQIERFLSSPQCDGIIGLGPEIAQFLRKKGHSGTLEKPVLSVFFSLVPQLESDLPYYRETEIPIRDLVQRDLDAFRRLTGRDEVTLLFDRGSSFDVVDQPRFEHMNQIQYVALAHGQGSIIPVLPEGTRSIYLMPLLHLKQDELIADLKSLSARGVAVFSMLGDAEVEVGALASLNTIQTYQAIGRSVALDMMEVFEGIDVERPRIVLPSSRLTINMGVAEQLGLELTWPHLAEATLVNQPPEMAGEPVTLRKTIQLAIRHNLDLAVRDRQVAAGQAEVRSVRSNLLPNLDLAVAGQTQDSAHAIPALGQYKSFSGGSATLTQLIYSEDARAARDASHMAQRARMADREALRMDVARSAIQAFLGLLKVDALVQIRRDDVDLNRTNLHLATLRKAVGTARPSEVERWKAQLANAQALLLESYAQRRQLERELSRLVNRSLIQRWSPQKDHFSDLLVSLGNADKAALLGTRHGYADLMRDLVAPAVAQSPELEAMDDMISAQMRELKASERAFTRPTVGLKAQVNNVFLKDEKGGIDLGDLTAGFGSFPDTSWNVALQVKMPLLTGGARDARKTKAIETLAELQIEREHMVQRISQRMLHALDAAAASYPEMELRKQASRAARRTLDMVQDAYAQGADSILVLLDAQNTALAMELAARQAEYAFLEDWADVQRAHGSLGKHENHK